MILVDSSVWIDHLRVPNAWLSGLLSTRQVLNHPFVRGELAMSNHLSSRDELIELLKLFPQVTVAENEEVIDFITVNKLYGKGNRIHRCSSALSDTHDDARNALVER